MPKNLPIRLCFDAQDTCSLRLNFAQPGLQAEVLQHKHLFIRIRISEKWGYMCSNYNILAIGKVIITQPGGPELIVIELDTNRSFLGLIFCVISHPFLFPSLCHLLENRPRLHFLPIV